MPSNEIPGRLEIPESWEKCEITGLTRRVDSVTITAEGGVVVINNGDRLTISMARDEYGRIVQPTETFPKMLNTIREEEPQAEIAFY